MNDKKCEKAAIDIPSGICAESGRVLGIAFVQILQFYGVCEVDAIFGTCMRNEYQSIDRSS